MVKKCVILCLFLSLGENNTKSLNKAELGGHYPNDSLKNSTFIDHNEHDRELLYSYRQVLSTLVNCRPVCYPHLGCITPEINCFSPFLGLCQTPDSLNEINPDYILYIKTHLNGFQLDYKSEQFSKWTPFASNSLVIVFIHGWNGETDSFFKRQSRFLLNSSKKELNIILVEWSSGTQRKNYQLGKVNSRVVGVHIGYVLVKLYQQFSFDLDQLMLVGFSLGGQLIHYTGQEVFKTNWTESWSNIRQEELIRRFYD